MDWDGVWHALTGDVARIQSIAVPTKSETVDFVGTVQSWKFHSASIRFSSRTDH